MSSDAAPKEGDWKGWAGFDKNSVKGNLKYVDYKPKTWSEDDVDIKIMYCGVCASDLHTLSAGWSEPVTWPQIVGHEIVGKAVKVGSEVKHVKVGDMVGVGAQNDSCLECEECKKHEEPYCLKGQVGTYNGVYQRREESKGDFSYGGYADYKRSPGHFVVKIPDGVDPADAAPMLCGGVTVYSPLKRYGAGTTAKEVGIVGIGGLGHFGLLFAKALGANVTAISHSENKKELAEKLGATKFIATHSGGEDDFKPYAKSLDLIVCTTNDTKMPLAGYVSLLKPHGHLVFVGVPEAPLPNIPVFPLIMGNAGIAGSAIGGPVEISEMLQFAADKGVKPMIQRKSMEDVNEVIVAQEKGEARFRFVLVNEKHGGKL